MSVRLQQNTQLFSYNLCLLWQSRFLLSPFSFFICFNNQTPPIFPSVFRKVSCSTPLSLVRCECLATSAVSWHSHASASRFLPFYLTKILVFRGCTILGWFHYLWWSCFSTTAIVSSYPHFRVNFLYHLCPSNLENLEIAETEIRFWSIRGKGQEKGRGEK